MRHPFDVIAGVLADRLGQQDASPQVRTAVISPATDWEHVVGMASEHLVLPAFAAALRDLQLAGTLEPDLRRFLAMVHGANAERNKALRSELEAVTSILNGAGIEPVLLKGAIRLVDGLYPDQGWRMMRDLDVLVPASAFSDAVQTVQRAGFTAAREIDRDRKDVKLRRRGTCIEIHKELFWPTRKSRLLRGAEVIEESRPAVLSGARARLPSYDHQLVHLIGHSQIGHFNYAYGRIPLHDRLEAAALVRRSRRCINWDAVTTRFGAAGYRRPLLVFLLSLSDGGLAVETVPGPPAVDALTMLQRRRIALQARSEHVARFGLYMGWWAALLKMHLLDRGGGGRRDTLRTLKTLAVDRDERRRIARIFAGGPRVR